MDQQQTILQAHNDCRIAIIYTVDDVGIYLVEIRDKSFKYFVGSNDEPCVFGNLNDARIAAKKCRAKAAFLALSKTYEEVDLSTDRSAAHGHNYDYMPITL